MGEFTIEREYATSAEHLWSLIISPEKMAVWFGGPEDMQILDAKIGFTEIGPWHAKMQGGNGHVFHVKGDIIAIEEFRVHFTWAWIMDDGGAGETTEVEMRVEAMPQGKAKWIIRHWGFTNDSAQNGMKSGWQLAYHNMQKHFVDNNSVADKFATDN